VAQLVQIDWNPDRRTLRQFGFIALGGFGLLAAAAWFEVLMFGAGLGTARAPVALALAGVGAAAALCSLLAPQANRWLYLGLICVSFPIGWVVSHAVLALLFFGIFAPIGLALRASGRDPLQRAREPGQASYWTPARRARPAQSYFKQF
jgi:hypothetical protein